MANKCTRQIIELVKLHPLLFDYKQSDYKNFAKKQETWKAIGASVGISGDHAKKKWKNVRDNYAKYCRAGKSPKGNNYMRRFRSWHWGEEMSFLKPYLQPPRPKQRTTTSNKNSIIISSDESENNQSTLWYDEDINNISKHENRLELKSEVISTEYIVPEDFKWPENIPNKRKHEETENHSQTYSTDKSVGGNYSYDDIDLICLGYAKTIKKFTPRRQSIIKFKIARLIMNEELAEKIENNDNLDDEPQSDPFA